jgi:hypothetical protein
MGFGARGDLERSAGGGGADQQGAAAMTQGAGNDESGPPHGQQGEQLHFVGDAVFRFDDLLTLTNRLRKIFRAPPRVGADPVTDLQLRYAVALPDLARFIERCGIGDDVANHFARLGAAFFDLPIGRQAEVLKPQTFANRAPTSSENWAIRANAVCAIEWFIQADLTLKDAIERAAKEQDLELACERGASLKSSLRTWRKSIKQGNGGEIAQGVYRQNCELIASLGRQSSSPRPPSHYEAFGTALLKEAADDARGLVKSPGE